MSEKNKKDDFEDFELDSNSVEEFEFEESKKEDNSEFDFDFDESKDKNKNSKENDLSDFDFELDEEVEEKTSSKKTEVEDDFDFELDEEVEEKTSSKKTEVEDDFDFELDEEVEEKTSSKKTEVEDDFDFELDEEVEEKTSSKKTEVEDDFDFELDEEVEEKVSSKSTKIEEDFDFELDEEVEEKVSSKSTKVEDDFDFEIKQDSESKKPAIAQTKNVDKEFDFEEIEEDFFETPKKEIENKKPLKLKENNETALNIDELFNDNKKSKDEDFDIDEFIKNDNSNNEFSSKKEKKQNARVNNDLIEDKNITESSTETVNLETAIRPQTESKKSFSLTKVMVSFVGVFAIASISYLGYLNKDNLSNIVSNQNIMESEEFRNKTIEIANEVAESKTFEYRQKLEEAISQINKLNDEQSNLLKENIRLKEQIDSIKNSQLNTDTSNIEMQIATFAEKINSMELQQDENKELLKKAVNATLSLIKENQNLDKNIEDKVYQKVYSEFEKIFNSQRFRLNDLSIIESKMNENVQIVNQIKQDLRQYKNENENLKTKIKLLENNEKATTSIVIDKKSKTESKKSVNENNKPDVKREVKEVKEVEKSLNQSNFKIQGIIDSNIAYIIVKGFNNSKAKAYTIGDNVPNCGKITKITENTVVCTGGTLKYNN